jgi:hypothetical protein
MKPADRVVGVRLYSCWCPTLNNEDALSLFQWYPVLSFLLDLLLHCVSNKCEKTNCVKI